jgi:serine/threonine protein kinase
MNIEVLSPEEMCGPYEIVREIARGGMAVVYQGKSPDGRDVAIKTLQFSPGLAESRLERFKREIQILAAIDHVHVVRFYEAGKLERADVSLVWMALELLKGPTLRRLIDERPASLPTEDVLRWCKHVADGVAAVHAFRVVHRDLKPSNVAIVEDVAKVFDFGISKFREWGVKTTDAATRLGTLGYMAPEQLEPERGEVDVRTDVFALGILLYEMASGAHPFKAEGPNPSPVQVVVRCLTQDPPPIGASFPADAAAIAMRALQKDPNRRFASMSEMSDALDEALRRYRAKRRSLAIGNLSGDFNLPPSLEPPAAGIDSTVRIRADELGLDDPPPAPGAIARAIAAERGMLPTARVPVASGVLPTVPLADIPLPSTRPVVPVTAPALTAPAWELRLLMACLGLVCGILAALAVALPIAFLR